MRTIIENSLKLLFPTIKNLEFHATGSQVYGYPNEDSDYDIIVSETRRQEILDILKQQNIDIEHSKLYKCIKFKFLNVVINLIFLDDRNKAAWIYTTNAMIGFKEFGERVTGYPPGCLTDKLLRCKLFNSLVKQFGGDPTTEVYKPTSLSFDPNEPPF